MMKYRLTFVYLWLMVLAAPLPGLSNNIQVSNIAVVEQNTTTHYSLVQFDLSWENSWRTSDLNGVGVTNWDAAWVFVKFRVGSGEWQHAKLNATGHEAGIGTPVTIDAGLLDPKTAFNATTNPAVGVFVYRQSDGTGTFTQEDIKIRWNYGENGVADDATIDIKVFAIEMVYVPEGAFWLGSGGSEATSFTNGSWVYTPGGGTQLPSIPYKITSELAIDMGPESDKLWGTKTTSGIINIGDEGTLPAGFPKGFAAFYAMKTEMTQKQYVDFLNTLTRSQQNKRVGASIENATSVVNTFVMSNTSSADRRNGIRCEPVFTLNDPLEFFCDLNSNGIGNEENDGQWVACNWLAIHDGLAYSDWAGLRPMTEMEFEKMCRGTANPVINEYAWGTERAFGTASYTLANVGEKTELIASNFTTIPNVGNAIHGSSQVAAPYLGPVRVGIFAANTSNTGRISAGASFYGVMELSGNLAERVVSVGQAPGRDYLGSHGDGSLTNDGFHNVTSWPADADASSIWERGGKFNTVASNMRTSYRGTVSISDNVRRVNVGFRAVRSKP